MTPWVVCDASAMVALLVDSGPDGRWAADALAATSMAAPELFPFEVANTLRRLELAGAVSPDQAAQAHVDLLDLQVELWPYAVLAHRCWGARQALTVYDAGYVALAEELDVPLVTLDRRLTRAPDVRCDVVSPERR